MRKLRNDEKIILTAITGVALGLLVLVILESGGSSHGIDQTAVCRNNLNRLDGVIMEWALEKRLPEGTPVTTNDILPYLRGGFPKCPIGGRYTLTKVGEMPTCSMPTNLHKIVR